MDHGWVAINNAFAYMEKENDQKVRYLYYKHTVYTYIDTE